MPLSAGSRVGPYEVLSAIGAGGMGEVYRARDTQLDRAVALKILSEAFAADADRLMRFTREAKTLASLNHPNIAAIHGIESGALVMELVEGEDLSAHIMRGAMPIADALPIARQIAEALAAAHEAGIIHRDLKPANIKVRHDGTVKVLDFGLAKSMEANGAVAQGFSPASAGSGGGPQNSPTFTSPAQMTQMGIILGTAAYMAPEQARGRPVDRRSDVWAFGVVLYEMLSGVRAFEGDDISITLANVLKDDVKWEALPAGLPAPLERLLRRCLEKNPAKRLDSMRAVALDLDDVLAGSGDPRVAPGSSAVRTDGMRRYLLIAASVVGAIALGAAAGIIGRDAWSPGAARVTDVVYQPVTFDAGFVYAARFARDGRTVVYSADWDGRPRDLFLTSVDSRDARPLGFAGADLLALGPSGEMAMLLNSTIRKGSPYVRQGALARTSMTGGVPRAELEGVLFADMAGDGTLAVVRLTDTEFLLEFPVGQVISRLPLVGGNFGTSGFVTPRVSPGGDLVAVMTPFGSTAWRTQVFRRGGALVTEDSHGTADWWGLAWRGPTEVWIAGTEAQGRQTSIFGLSLDGTRRLVYRAAGGLSLHDISRDGDVLGSFDRFNRRVELIDGSGEPRDLSWQDGGVAAGLSDGGVALLHQDGDGGGPHGSALAFAKGASQPVRIAEGIAHTLSPDGSTALVTRDAGASLVPIGPGQARPIDLGAMKRLGWTGWHPDGRLILDIVRPDESRRTYAVAATAGPLTPFLPPGLSLNGGRLISPDGHRIIATGADGQLVRCALPAASCQPLPGRRAADEVAGWLADNHTVIVVNDRVLPGAVDALDVDSGRRMMWRTLRPMQYSLSGIRRVVVAPNGTMLLGYDRSRTELYVIRGLR
ncbi:MAG TPA: serine/threonine-protein kinase [Vicinamibacterales bacterium]|nr:serine/threonine-protein kinase [Vicinamibacterales bacterium]